MYTYRITPIKQKRVARHTKPKRPYDLVYSKSI